MACKPVIKLLRTHLPDGSATIGVLTIGAWQCCTLELPWFHNEPGVSCIPDGKYPLVLRDSKAVERSSGGEFTEGWQVSQVPNRSFIMFHVGNYARDTDGCILVGKSFAWSATDGPLVTSSKDTFREFMRRMNVGGYSQIHIRHVQPMEVLK